jgi:hypothetical protein
VVTPARIEIGRSEPAWPILAIPSAAVGEGQVRLSGTLTQFDACVDSLRDGDDRNLGRLGLPRPDEINKLTANRRRYVPGSSYSRLNAIRRRCWMQGDTAGRSGTVAHRSDY